MATKTSLLAMVHGVAAVDIGGSVVYEAVDRNEEMGLRVDWSISGIGCGRSYYDGGWTDLWRKDHKRDECHRVSGHIHHALRKQKICRSETEKIGYTRLWVFRVRAPSGQSPFSYV